MGIFSEYRYAQVENDLIVVAVESNGDSPKAIYSLIVNGIEVDQVSKMMGKFSLIGKADPPIEVKIKQVLFGTKYKLTVGGKEHELIKSKKKEVIDLINQKRAESLAEVQSFDKENAKIYPILKPGNWNGLEFSAHRVLLGEEKNPLLVVAYGYNLSQSLSFLTINDLEQKSLKEIHQEAWKNIDEHEVKIEISNKLPEPILLASGDDFSAEKLLSKSFLLKAQELLNSDELLISIPRRRCMMIAPKNASEETLEKFTFLHSLAWKEDNYGNAPIFNGLFIIKDGAIQNVIPIEE